MAIRKREGRRGVTWQIDYLDPNGVRVRQSFKKRKDAEAELGKRVSLIAEKRYLDIKKDYTTTLGQLIEKYMENFKHLRSYRTSKSHYLENIKGHFGKDTLLSRIEYMDVESYKNRLRTKATQRNGVRTIASINREMSCFRHLMRKAVSWKMMGKSPFADGESLLEKENNARKRFLSQDEITRLLAELKPKSLVYRVVFCALNTGMRRGEILNLRWEEIRNGFIYLTETKTNERREIPINDDLGAMLDEIREEQRTPRRKVVPIAPLFQVTREPQESPSPHVFIYAGKKVGRVPVSFYSALKRAGIENFRFHDLRHTFASHLVMRGASLKEVQELLGHKDIKMTMRYAHLAQENKKTAVSLLNGFASCVNSGMSQTCHKLG